jgi:hypothetical protein
MTRFLIGLVILGFFWSCNFKPASVRYNDHIIQWHTEIEASIDSLSYSISQAKIQEIQRQLVYCRATLSSVENAIKEAESFEEDSLLLNAITQYCATYDSILGVYPAKIVAKYRIPNESYDFNEHKNLEWIIKQFNVQRNQNIDNLRQAQIIFAKNHGFKL